MDKPYCPTCLDNGYYYSMVSLAMPYEPFQEIDRDYGGDFNKVGLQICFCEAGARFIRARRLEKIMEQDDLKTKKELCLIYKEKLKDLLAIKQELDR